MARVVGTVLQIYGAFTGNPYIFYAGVAINAGDSIEQSRRQRRRDRALYNAAQKDRLEMVDRDPNQARSLVMGRVRYVEGVRRPWQSGTHMEVLTLPVSFAGHEIDGFEQFYLFDQPVTLDGSGWVQEAPYKRFENGVISDAATVDGSGNATVTLTGPVVSGTLVAEEVIGTGQNQTSSAVTVTLAGTFPTQTASASGLTPAATLRVMYQTAYPRTNVRIRPYLGTSAQNVGAAISSEYGGALRVTDKYQGMALCVMDCIFDQDVFPQGRPTLTALMRGAKLYDPRKDSTVSGGSGSHRYANPSTWEWSENPALQVLRYFTWEYGWNRPIDEISLADVMEAANDCDVSTVFTMRKTDGSTSTVTLPRYRCGIAISSDADRRESMDAILETMNGSRCWAGGIFRFRAGKKRTAAFTVTESWLAESVDQSGQTSGEAVIQGVNGVPRDRRINFVSGRCVDPDQRHQLLAFPAVQDPVLVAAKGVRADDVTYEGVNHIAHAQHLASMAIRKAQAGLRMEVQCGLRALLQEPLDVAAFQLPDYGFAGNEAEVVSWRYSPNGTIRLAFEETSAGLYTVDAELKGRDPAPDSSLRRPWSVEDIGTVSVSSGIAAITDSGSIITRMKVSWPAVVGEEVRRGGEVEVQYTDASQPLPSGEWPSWVESGSATSAVIPGVLSGRPYLVRVRAVQKLPLVRGKWTYAAGLHVASDAPDAGLYSLEVGAAAINLAADANGTVGSFAGATATVRVLRSGIDNSTFWALGKTDGSGVTSTFSTGLLSITALSVDASYVDLTATRAGYAPLTVRLPVTKAKGGASVRPATVYIQAASAPSAPTGGTFNFGTGVLTPPSGWSASRPAVGVDPTYSADFQFVGPSPTSVITAGTWSAPVQIAAGVPTSYIVSPGTNSFTAKTTATPTTCVSGIRLRTTGAIAKKASGTSATYNNSGEWYHGTPPITYYVRFVQDTLSAGSLSGVGGGWLALSSDRSVELTATAGVVAAAVVNYQIASDSGGGTIVSLGVLTLEAEST